jgi:Putative Ig domain
VNTAPLFGSPPDPNTTTITGTQAFSYSIPVRDPDGDQITIMVVDKPDWLIFDPATNTLSTLDTAKLSGVYQVLIQASDGRPAGTTSLKFTIIVN